MAGIGTVSITIACLLVGIAHGHVVITYPGWRGNNLIVNDEFPYGMQRSYPCGGLSATQNRTAWPITNGALAMQPGWFAGHATALMYINLGLGSEPDTYSPMVPMFRLTGPSDNPYPGTVCLPQVSPPQGVVPKNGDLATIQVVQTLKSGASLYSCADIVFTDDPSKLPPVSADNCFNSTTIHAEAVQVVGSSDVMSCTRSETPQPTGDVSGTASTTSNRRLFPSQTATSEKSSAARGISGLSALLSFLPFI